MKMGNSRKKNRLELDKQITVFGIQCSALETIPKLQYD